MKPIDEDRGVRLFGEIEAALAAGPLPVEELARRAGCTPREAMEVLQRFDRAGRTTIALAGEDEDVVVRPSRVPG